MIRGWLASAAIAAAVLVAIVAVGFGVQAAAIGRPARAELLVSHVIGTLIPYSTSEATITINGRHLVTRCQTRWIHEQRRTIVRIAHGATIEEIGNHLLDDQPMRFAEFELAGCPRVVRKWLATQINTGTPVRADIGVFDGMHVVRLRFPGGTLGLMVYLKRGTELPAQLGLSGPRIDGQSRIRYGVPAKPTVKHPHVVIGSP